MTITAREDEECHEIVVSNNGIGFDVTDLSFLDGTHIGIKNVKERIEKLCNGSMNIQSQIGMGTMITIRIPPGGTDAP